MELLRITYTDYSEKNGQLIARATGRSETGKRRTLTVKNTKPFIFVPKDEKVPQEIHQLITSVEDGYKSFDGIPLKKLNLDHPQSTNDVTPFFSKTYESDVPYYRRLALEGLNGYIRVPKGKSTLDISEIETDVEPDSPIDPRIVIADIEVKVGNHGIEEMMENADMPILCISLWDNFGDSYYQFVLDDENHVDGKKVREYLKNHWSEEYSGYAEADVELIRCKTEEDLLNSFINEIRKIRPDLISGWNFISFDWKYLLSRMVELEGVNPHRLSDIGGMSHRQLNSDREDVVARSVDGLPAFDMMEGYLILIFKKIRSKALDYVAHKDLGIGKVEGININKAYEEDRSKLVAYNLIDSQLCVAIDEANDIFGFFFELSEICNIPIWDTVVPMRRIDGYILSRRDRDEVLPAAEKKELPKAAGALVFEPPTGILDWVGVHDLASLYPSTIISWNISPETVTRDLDEADLIVPDMPDPDDVEGRISPDEVKFDGNGVLGTRLDEQGVVPKYLNQLFPMRDEKKALRNDHDPGDIKYRMYDNQQYAVKVVQNIGFGVLGNKHWRLSDKGLADAVTGGGRYVIWKSSEIIRELGHDLLAGDSILPDEPVLIRRNGQLDIVPISSLEDEDNVEVWSDGGFTRIKRVIRKPYDKSKEIYTVRSSNGIVHVTEDHSLISENGTETSPKEADIGDSLLHEDIGKVNGGCKGGIDNDLAWLLGLFVAEGSCGKYDTNYGYKSTWAINNQDDEILEEASRILEEKFPWFEAKIDDVMDSSNTKKLRVRNGNYGNIRDMVQFFRGTCYIGKQKRVPKSILNSDEETQRAFLRGFHVGEGYIDESQCINIEKEFDELWSRDKILMSGVVFILRNLGLEYSLGTRRNYGNEYYRSRCPTRRKRPPEEIAEISEYDYDGDYVYDLETENHHFHAGIGSMIVHNTDSLIVSLGEEDDPQQEVMERGFEVEESLNKQMDILAEEVGLGDGHPYIEKAHHGKGGVHLFEFEYEKLYEKFLQAGKKKRYAGKIVWKEGKDVDEIDITGFEFQRSDVPSVAAEAQKSLIEGVLRGKPFTDISNEIQGLLKQLFEDFSVRQHGIPSVLNQPIEEYPNRPVKRATRYSNEYLGYDWTKGSNPFILYVNDTPPELPPTDVIAVDWSDEIPEGFSIDYSEMEEKCFEQPLDKVLNLLGWKWREIKTGKRSKSISDW